MDIRPIRNDDDLAWAIAEVSVYFEDQPEPGTPEADRFDVLSDLVEAYENKVHPIGEPEPIELLKAFMDMKGYTQSDLGELIGSRPRASEVLARKRRLSMAMVRKLNAEWKIPADPLIVPYALEVG